MTQIDYTKGYPRVCTKSPRQMLAKYQEIMLKVGLYPRAGQARGFGGIGAWPSDALDIQSELDREYRKKMAVCPGVEPKELRKFIADNPGAARLRTGVRLSCYDPQPLGFLGKHFVKRQDRQRALDIQEVMSCWSEYARSGIGAHTKIENFEAGKLMIRCDSTAWVIQLKWLISQIEKRLAERLGSNTVKQIITRGPVVPPRKRDHLSVPGRGPRGTYDWISMVGFINSLLYSFSTASASGGLKSVLRAKAAKRGFLWCWGAFGLKKCRIMEAGTPVIEASVP